MLKSKYHILVCILLIVCFVKAQNIKIDIPAIEKAFDCNRCGISVVGLEVPHAHIHLIPINSANDLNFVQPKPQASVESLKKVQERILAQL